MARDASAQWERFVRAAARQSATLPRAGQPVRVNLSRKRAERRSRTGRRPDDFTRSPARDLRLLPAAATAWVTAACAIRLSAPEALLLGSVLALITAGCAAAAYRNHAGHPAMHVLLMAFGVAAMVCFPVSAHLQQRESASLEAAISAEAHVTAQLVALMDAKEIASAGPDGSKRWLLEAELVEGTYNGLRFSARTPVIVLGGEGWKNITHGDMLRSAGKALPTEPGDRARALLIASTDPVLVGPHHRPLSLVERLRIRFLALSASTAAPDGGLMPGMVIGARSAVDPELADTMKATGLTHLTAVSGANCSYVLAFVFVLCRACRFPRWAAGVAGVAALAGFVLLVRPEPSVLRAAVMGSIGVLAVLTGRGKLSMTLLFLSIAVLLASDPWLSVEYAFILSVAATSGLVLAGPVLAARLSALMPEWAAQLIAVPLAAQLFCSPVLALIQPSMPTYSLLANIAAAPLVPFITIAGMVAVAFAALLPWAAVPFAAAAGWAAAGVGVIARFFASAPFAALPWPSGSGGAVLTAMASAAILAAAVWGPQAYRRARSMRDIPLSRDRNEPFGDTRRRRVAEAATWIAAGCILTCTALWAWSGSGGMRTPEWTVAACDVGQGDGLAVRTGERSAIVVDAGPEAGTMDTCLDRLGVDYVDLLLLTHFHEDHYAGVSGVFEGRGVRRVLYSTAEGKLPAEVAEASRAGGVVAERAGAGTAGTIGNVDWSVMWPMDEAAAGSENNASAVLLVSVGKHANYSGLDILFTGDLEADAAARFLSLNAGLAAEGVDILKVAHHGARNGGAEMVQALRPLIAVISVGRGNDYGHPHPSTLDALEAAGTHVVRTDQQGTVLLTVSADAVNVLSSR